jgi:Ca-activated chloride channel homolog
MRNSSGFLPIVLFLTDGLPTVGQSSEKAIRELATKGNPQHRRIFAFGIGLDVNTPLLDKLAVESRAASTYVLPKEDIEVKVAQVFRRLSGPVLMDPALRVANDQGGPAYGRVHDMIPGRLPDLFDGDQLIILGQYKGEEPLRFELKGEDGERTRTFRFRFDLSKASTRDAFVPRLWASRKIAVLTDAIRDLGSDRGPTVALRADHSRDPRMTELVGEVIRLSKQFGVLSEYTAFLAREGMDLAAPPDAFVRLTKTSAEWLWAHAPAWNPSRSP